jgi:endoglucanase
MVGCSAEQASVADQEDTFDGSGSSYLDDVRAWQTNEPGLDMTGTAIVAAAAHLSD